MTLRKSDQILLMYPSYFKTLSERPATEIKELPNIQKDTGQSYSLKQESV